MVVIANLWMLTVFVAMSELAATSVIVLGILHETV